MVYTINMKRIGFLSTLLILLVLSCNSGPQHTEPSFAHNEAPEAVSAEVGGFDPARISEEMHEAAMTELRAFVESLNAIIRARNYDAWVSYLSDSFYEEINSPAFLVRRTEELFRRDQMVAYNLNRDPRRVQKRVLNNSRDFFYNVVVPARSNDRLDNIAFISENRVKAYTVDNRGNRLVLYDLERIDNRWQIIN